MATFKYFIKGKGEFANIYFRLLDGRNTDIKILTTYLIKPEYWNTSKGIVKQDSLFSEKIKFQKELDDLKTYITTSFNEAKPKGVEINKQWLENVRDEKLNPRKNTDLLISSLENYRDSLKSKVNNKTKRATSTGTLRNYNTTISRLKKFESHTNKEYVLTDVDLTFHSKYLKFAINNLGLSNNSIQSDFKKIKTVCLDARDRGQDINKQVESRKFGLSSEKTSFVTISEDELKRIKLFKGSNHLENARDWLIIGCWTGCRVDDLMRLSNDNIHINTKGQRFIRYTQSKTNKQVDLAIHPDVQEILDRLNGFPRPISDQKFNDYIKKVCKDEKVGMSFLIQGTRQNPKTHKRETGMFEKWQLIRSHTCRRSFATNHYNKISNKLIMKVTGHSTEAMLLNYIGETDNDHLEDFIGLYNTTPTENNTKVKQINL